MKKSLSMFMTLAVLLCFAAAVPSVSAVSVNDALLSYIAGDVNGDWAVTSSDVRTVYASVAGESADTALPKAADVNADGAVNAMDVLLSLQTTVGAVESVLLKPAQVALEATPAGDAVSFEKNYSDHQYAHDQWWQGDVNKVWVAQSLKELQAVYAHSDCVKDFSAEYDEAFFADKAVIVWEVGYEDYGLMGISMKGIVKSGSQLCLVRELDYFLTMGCWDYDRYILEISKADLEGVDSICTVTEKTYR